MISIQDYIKEHCEDSIKKLNIRRPVDIYTILKMIRLQSKRPLEIMGGLAVKHDDMLYMIKYRRDYIHLDKFEDPWQIISKVEFLSGVGRPPEFSAEPTIDEEFYQNKYYIVDVSGHNVYNVLKRLHTRDSMAILLNGIKCTGKISPILSHDIKEVDHLVCADGKVVKGFVRFQGNLYYNGYQMPQ